MTAGWRPALRIARRTVRRNLARSLLVALLVAVPVSGATMVDVLFRSTSGGEVDAERSLGEADAIVEVLDHTALPGDYYPAINAYFEPVGSLRDPADVDIAGMLPAGTRLIDAPLSTWGLWLVIGDHNVRTGATVVPFDDPLTRHEVRLESGQWPNADNEVLVTNALADRLGILADDSVPPETIIELHGGPELVVTGLALDPFALGSEEIFAAPGSAVARYVAAADGLEIWSTTADNPTGLKFLADLPDGTDVDTLWRTLAADGVRMVPRDAVVNPDSYAPEDGYGFQSVELAALGLVALVVGLGLFEVVLLAGAAFAVGARRQVRDLGLMAAGGASAAQIRRVVLTQGLVLGALGAAFGLVFGGLIALLGKPLWERTSGMLIETWRIGPSEILAAAGVGLLSGLAAAIIPAIGAARMKPVDALSGRFRTTKLAARMPLAGVVLTAGGTIGALVASRVAAGEFADYAERLQAAEGTGRYVSTPDTSTYVALQLLGAAVTLAGVVIMIPGIVAMLARSGRRLPLSGRLAMRDAARHRHRTAPTVAAIMIVVAGSIGMAFAVQGTQRAEDLRYTPFLPPNTAEIGVDTWGIESVDASAVLDRAVKLATTQLPDAEAHAASRVFHAESDLWVECVTCPPDEWVSESLWVGDEHAIALTRLAGADPQDVAAALDRGNVVVFDPALVEDGHVTVTSWTEAGDSQAVRLPAYVAERDAVYTALPGALVPPGIVQAEGWEATHNSTVVAFHDVADDMLDQALSVVESTGAYTYVERREAATVGTAMLVLAAGAALVTLVGVAVAVTLSAVEGRADLATLAAVGAQPWRRRSLMGSQALVVSGLGTVLGVALGAYFAYLAWPAIGAPEFTVPWGNIALTGIAVPALAAVVAMVFTPSRLPILRRMA